MIGQRPSYRLDRQSYHNAWVQTHNGERSEPYNSKLNKQKKSRHTSLILRVCSFYLSVSFAV